MKSPEDLFLEDLFALLFAFTVLDILSDEPGLWKSLVDDCEED